MNDKFILMGLDDERSKNVAEVLGNKTCKKVIDYLAEIKEASEKDISDALKIPINTVEYNLKKLLNSGLVEKTKNFFWSKKGKKIPMYKLAKKHIIISPKIKKPSLTALKTIIPVALISGVGAVLIRQFLLVKEKVMVEGGEIVKIASLDATEVARNAITSGECIAPQTIPVWIWFLLGALLATLIFTILNWRKL